MSEQAGGPSPGPMSAERWARLAPMIDAALDLTPDRRRAYVDRITSSDARLGAELERCLAASDGEDSLLDRAADARSSLLFEREDDARQSSADLQALLQQALGSVYTVERELGGAGMSRVFVADEPALTRKVVIKVVAPEPLPGIGADRFKEEIRLAAALQQANIVPLLAAGSAAGLPYYTMPFVDGQSLLDRLAREGPLSIRDAVSVLRDVARALAYAHARGVVHRDIKPGNVLLSGGTAVVTDFGIAKALVVVLGSADPDGAAEVSTAIGTPAYMAPEQARSIAGVDHRADLYSFGCLAHAVFTGAPPFGTRSSHRMIEAHLTETPRLLSELRPNVPRRLVALVARCLEKDPARRPQHASALLEVLDEETERPTIAPPGRWATKLVLAGGIAAGGLLSAFGAMAMRRSRDTNASASPLTLAVVPFRTVAGDTALDYLADRIGDELLTSMGKVSGVQTTGRNAAYRYKKQSTLNVLAVERELGARLLVTGTIRRREGRLIVSTQLDDSMSRGELWAETYARDTGAVGAVSHEMAEAITEALRKRFGDAVGVRTATSVGTTSAAALDLYLVGNALANRRGAGIAQSVAYFERAIAADSGFARAHAALAMALWHYPYYFGTPPEEVRPRVVTAARRAIALDPTLAEPHIALGWANAHAGVTDAATAEFERALALAPDNVDARFSYGRFLMWRGRTEEALAQFQLARRGERVSSRLSAWIGYAHFTLGHADSAATESALAVQLDSTLLPTTNLGALMHLAHGQHELARRLMTIIPPPSVMTNAPYVYAMLGDTATVRRLLSLMAAHRPTPWFTDAAMASVMLARNDTAGFLAALERSESRSGPMWVAYIPPADPAYDAVRGSARFAALARRAGIDERALVRRRRAAH